MVPGMRMAPCMHLLPHLNGCWGVRVGVIRGCSHGDHHRLRPSSGALIIRDHSREGQGRACIDWQGGVEWGVLHSAELSTICARVAEKQEFSRVLVKRASARHGGPACACMAACVTRCACHAQHGTQQTKLTLQEVHFGHAAIQVAGHSLHLEGSGGCVGASWAGRCQANDGRDVATCREGEVGDERRTALLRAVNSGQHPAASASHA